MRVACTGSPKGTQPVCDVLCRAGCEERGERAVPEELCGQLVRHHPGLVLQKEALAGEETVWPICLCNSPVFTPTPSTCLDACGLSKSSGIPRSLLSRLFTCNVTVHSRNNLLGEGRMTFPRMNKQE